MAVCRSVGRALSNNCKFLAVAALLLGLSGLAACSDDTLVEAPGGVDAQSGDDLGGLTDQDGALSDADSGETDAIAADDGDADSLDFEEIFSDATATDGDASDAPDAVTPTN